MITLRRSDRIVAASVLRALLATWLLLVALDAFTALADELAAIGKGSYTVGTAFAHLAWTLPRRAYEGFPTAAVIGALAGLGALAPTAELTAMRAGGLSKARIAAAAAGAAGAVLAVVAASGETLAPWAEHHAQQVQASALSEDLIALGRSGVWARDGGTLLNAARGEMRGDGVVLFDIRVYEFDAEGRLQRISTAARGEHGAGGWVLHDVVRQTLGEDAVASERFVDYAWPSVIDPRVLSLSAVKPRHLGLADLAAGIKHLDRNGLDASEWRTAYWRRVFYPLNVLLLVLIALPFAFGTLRSGGLGKRLFIGILLAVGWNLAQRALGNVGTVYGVDPRLLQVVPATVLALAVAWYFRRHA
ncbi:MAG: LPS export ABC transporter permease LptG [Pseudomonadota bacterium]